MELLEEPPAVSRKELVFLTVRSELPRGWRGGKPRNACVICEVFREALCYVAFGHKKVEVEVIRRAIFFKKRIPGRVDTSGHHKYDFYWEIVDIRPSMTSNSKRRSRSVTSLHVEAKQRHGIEPCSVTRS